jgi:hypothetical protein
VARVLCGSTSGSGCWRKARSSAPGCWRLPGAARDPSFRAGLVSGRGASHSHFRARTVSKSATLRTQIARWHAPRPDGPVRRIGVRYPYGRDGPFVCAGAERGTGVASCAHRTAARDVLSRHSASAGLGWSGARSRSADNTRPRTRDRRSVSAWSKCRSMTRSERCYGARMESRSAPARSRSGAPWRRASCPDTRRAACFGSGPSDSEAAVRPARPLGRR